MHELRRDALDFHQAQGLADAAEAACRMLDCQQRGWKRRENAREERIAGVPVENGTQLLLFFTSSLRSVQRSGMKDSGSAKLRSSAVWLVLVIGDPGRLSRFRRLR
jgi:hypothetical protein